MKESVMIMLTIGLLSIGLAGGCSGDTTKESQPSAPAGARAEPETRSEPLPTAKGADMAAGEKTSEPVEQPSSDAQVPVPAENEDREAVEPPVDTAQAPAEDEEKEKTPVARSVSRDDLLHRHFVLISADGVDFSAKEKVPDLEFGEDFRVLGAVCNRFMGQGELESGTLTVKQMASTKMMCLDPELNALEQQFAGMLEAGAVIDFDGKILTLRQGGHTLIYELRDWVR